MAEGTKIEWTHRPGTIPATLNALVGCQKVSAGCKNCYAIEVANIRAGNPLPIMQEKFAGTVKREGGKRVWTGKVTLTEKALLDPLRRKKPRTYFVNALSDLFYEGVPDKWIAMHLAVFALCPQHTFIVLTKRPERMRAYMGRPSAVVINDISLAASLNLPIGLEGKMQPIKWPLPNVWLGTSVEDQETANVRIPELLQTPAAIRIVSAEPLLGLIDFRKVPGFNRIGLSLYNWWIIAGGESGPGARPMHPDWARSLRDQCVAAGVPFFFKQWGEWGEWRERSTSMGDNNLQPRIRLTDEGQNGQDLGSIGNNHVWMQRVGKKSAGHLLDGVEWHQFPESA